MYGSAVCGPVVYGSCIYGTRLSGLSAVYGLFVQGQTVLCGPAVCRSGVGRSAVCRSGVGGPTVASEREVRTAAVRPGQRLCGGRRLVQHRAAEGWTVRPLPLMSLLDSQQKVGPPDLSAQGWTTRPHSKRLDHQTSQHKVGPPDLSEGWTTRPFSRRLDHQTSQQKASSPDGHAGLLCSVLGVRRNLRRFFFFFCASSYISGVHHFCDMFAYVTVL